MSDWLMIIGMFILTFLPRYIPLVLADKLKISPLIESALKFVPIAVLTSIITHSSLIREGELSFNIYNYYLYAALVSFTVSKITNSLIVVVASGMTAFYVTKIIFEKMLF